MTFSVSSHAEIVLFLVSLLNQMILKSRLAASFSGNIASLSLEIAGCIQMFVS